MRGAFWSRDMVSMLALIGMPTLLILSLSAGMSDVTEGCVQASAFLLLMVHGDIELRKAERRRRLAEGR